MSVFDQSLFDLEHGAIVTLCQVDTTPAGYTYTLNFHPYNTDQVAVFNGVTYLPMSVEMSGFKSTTNGLPTPRVTIGNAMGTVSQAIANYNGLQGAKFTRFKTLRQFIGLPANPNYIMGHPDIFYIDRVSAESAIGVTFDLKSDQENYGLKLPRQQITKNYCTAQFKSAECGYVGANTICDRTLNGAAGCRFNFGANAILNFNGCPEVDYVG
jgi:lambda family phage minor tail protein L